MALVEWNFPRTGSCHEGMAFADGVTGVLAWGGGGTLNLTVGRADMWDHRGGYRWTDGQSYANIADAVRSGDGDRLLKLFDKETPAGEPRNPYMLPLGRVVIEIRGRELKRGTLDPFTGLGEIELSGGGKIALAMSKKRRAFALRFPEGAEFSVKSAPATDHPVFKNDLEPVGFEKAASLDGAAPDEGGFVWNLPADEPARLVWRRRVNRLSLSTARGGAPAAGFTDYETAAADSAAAWKAFWKEGARINVPDPVIQREFEYGMYRFGAMTDPDGIPAGLQGPWLEDDQLVPWNGDYHFNINVQECYSPAYRGGHFANLRPLFDMVLSWRPRLRENARRFAGVENGYTLPHSVDDRGTCIGGFWTGTIDHGSTAWTAAMMFRYVRYSGDAGFLRAGAYDFMKGAMNVYLAMMEEKDGRLSIPLGPSPEWGAADVRRAVGRDPSFQLACAHRIARDLTAAAALLGEAPDPRWLDVERRLPPYTSSDPERGIDLFEGTHFSESHRHHSHMAGFYPFDTIDMTRDTRTLERTYHAWIMHGHGLWSGWCVPWASILHTHVGNARAAVQMLRDWDRYFCNPGHGSHHDGFIHGFTVLGRGGYGPSGNVVKRDVMQMDGQCAAATAAMELLVHEVNGRTEFFRGCPEDWTDVSFENIALSDGTRVSGRRLNGATAVDRASPDGKTT